MEIVWVNHASYITKVANLQILCDPWIEGRVFNNSWEHISSSKIKQEDFAAITHIWFSHEHPDHFFPPNLQQIPEAIRKQITVLYQITEDKKVVNYCKKLGFKNVVELLPMQWMELNSEVRIMNAKVKNDTDSWLILKTKDHTLVNFNDCIFENENRLLEIKKHAGEVDVLFTQFSYACWCGNEDDKPAREQSAANKLNAIAQQIKTMDAKTVVPFASYVWFCHPDNFYMNDSINHIGTVSEFIKSTLNKNVVVLYPGENWMVNTPHENANAIANYETDLAEKLKTKNLTPAKIYSFEELKKSAEAASVKALSKNYKAKLLQMKPANIFVTDLNQAVSFSFKNGLSIIEIEKNNCDVSMSSQPLKYCFDFEWGSGTINVAGTYYVPKNGNYNNFLEYDWVWTLNNCGKRLGNVFQRIWYRIKNN